MVDNGYGIVRYSDDFIILSHDRLTAQRALEDAAGYLTSRLMLRLNPETSVKSLKQGFTYMGFFFRDDTLKIDEAKFQRIKEKIRYICINHIDKPLHEFIHKINDEVESLRNYYRPLAPAYQINSLEEYLKLQVGLLLQKKKRRGQLNTRKRVFFDLRRMKQLADKPYSKSKRFINEVLDIAWGVNRGRKFHKQDGSDDRLPLHEKPGKTGGQQSESVEKKVTSKKREYHKKRILTGNLVISTRNMTANPHFRLT